MANPQTTHVIEIETGIGEPAFIPLSMGHELQPISVGKKGMWRIESPRVLDVHAFVYYDGTSLFLQSADEQSAASVDGYRVGKAWTELHAPCMIEVGTARLRYRSLIADSDNQPTMMAMAPPVKAPAGGPGGPGSPLGDDPAPGATGSRPGTGSQPNGGTSNVPPAVGSQPQLGGGPQRMGTGARPMAQPSTSPPVAFPKADRPFKPGEFSAPQDADESTRIAPLESTGANRAVAGPRPAAGAPAGDHDPSTRPEAARVVRMGSGAVAAIPSGAYPAMNNGLGSQPGTGVMQQQPMMQGGMGPGGMQGMQGMQPQGMQGFDPQQQGMQPQGGPQQGFDPQQGYGAPGGQQGYGGPPGFGPAGSGAYGALASGNQQIPGAQGSMAPGGFGSMTPQGGMQQPGAAPAAPKGFYETLKANSIPKMVAGLLFVIGGVFYLATDDDGEQVPKRKPPVAAADAGPKEAGAMASTATGSVPSGAMTTPPVSPPTGATNAWPPGVPCPPPNWPPNTPLPCTPNNAAPPPPDPVPTGGKSSRDGGRDRDPKDRDPKDAGAPLPAGTKTLERQAVDYVVAGDTAKAAAAYEELVRRDPNNKVYAEAARILRAKLDGGLPGQ